MRVLLAEEEASGRKFFSELLTKWGYEVHCASDGGEAWQALERMDAPCLAVVNLHAAKLDGLEIARRLRDHPLNNEVHLILLADAHEREAAARAVEAGGDDYLIKPYDPVDLRVRFRLGKRMLELKSALRLQSTRDPLTHLWNRAAIFDILKQELARAKRHAATTALVMVGIDHLNRINGSCGPFAGDGVLCEVSRRIRSAIRAYDSVGRYGGATFLVVLPGCGMANGTQQAKRLQRCIEQRDVSLAQQQIPVTCTLGVVATDIAPEVGAELLLHGVNTAFLRAKESGAGRVVVATPEDLLMFSKQL